MPGQTQRGFASQPHLPPSIARPFRESLRGLRRALYLGRYFVHDAVERSMLPAPVNDLARSVLTEVDLVAGRVEGLANNMVREVLGEGGRSISGSVTPQRADYEFAAAYGAALRNAIRQMGVPDIVVDDGVTARVRASIRGVGPAELDALEAAQLVCGVIEDDLHGYLPSERDSLAVAGFAVMLWFLSDQGRDPAVFAASISLSAALTTEILQAVPDPKALADLLLEFRDHV